MVTADAVVINCPQGCVLQMATIPHLCLFYVLLWLNALCYAVKYEEQMA